MGIKNYITDKARNTSAEIADGSGEMRGLVVATRPLKIYENKIIFFSNDTYGIDMNKDAASGGVPEKVHDGTDSVLWTASDIKKRHRRARGCGGT